ncbi:MAG: hypothetical protein WCP97_02400 [bacterium]
MGEIAIALGIVFFVGISFLKINTTTQNLPSNSVKTTYQVAKADERPPVLVFETSPSQTSKNPTATPFPSVTPLPEIPDVVADNSKLQKNFWAKDFKAQWLSQTQSSNSNQYFDVHPGDSIVVQAKFKNTGKRTWYSFFGNASLEDKKSVTIAIYKDPKVKSSWSGKDDPKNPDYGSSEFRSYYLAPGKLASPDESVVAPGETGTFSIHFDIPFNAPEGQFREDITVAAGPYWMESNKETADPIGAAHIWVGFNITKDPAVTKKIQLTDVTTPYSIAYNSTMWNYKKDTTYDYRYFELKENPECIVYIDFYGQFSTTATNKEIKALDSGKEIHIERFYTNNELQGETYSFDFGHSPLHPVFTLHFPPNTTKQEKAALSQKVWEIVKTLSY